MISSVACHSTPPHTLITTLNVLLLSASWESFEVTTSSKQLWFAVDENRLMLSKNICCHSRSSDES
jgi:hypothetical protein